MGVMRTKSVEQSIKDTEEPEFQLRKALGPLDLTVFGIGVIIGTGLFVLTGEAAAGYAGPAVALSFVVGGVACALAALCYAEFASSVPVAGSAYTFSYATIGEIVAWLIGWDLILEFTLGAATVAKGWSGYFVSVFDIIGIQLPPAIYAAEGEGFSHDWLSLVVVALVTIILVVGIRLSSLFNQVITAIKILVTLFIIGYRDLLYPGINLTPFIPPPEPASGGYGERVAGLPHSDPAWDRHHLRSNRHLYRGGARLLRLHRLRHRGDHVRGDPQPPARSAHRDPGFSGNLYDSLHSGVDRLYRSRALQRSGHAGACGHGPGTDAVPGCPVRSSPLAILIGLTVVVMILILGQSRVAFAMSRDNLLPQWFSRVHSTFRTPYRITIITGIVSAILAFWLPLVTLGELVNIGTLAAFVLVSVGVIILRRTRPDLPRSFRVPLYPVVPILAALACLFVMGFLTIGTWLRFFVWMAIGLIWYFAYSRTHSREARRDSEGEGARTG